MVWVVGLWDAWDGGREGEWERGEGDVFVMFWISCRCLLIAFEMLSASRHGCGYLSTMTRTLQSFEIIVLVHLTPPPRKGYTTLRTLLSPKYHLAAISSLILKSLFA